MSYLKVLDKKGQLVTDSRDVAEMIGKEHRNLIRDIRRYINILESSNLSSQDFFIANTYMNSQNKEQPCYLLTKQGCEMVANKMTGEKGVLFTAKYVQAFNMVENIIKSSKTINLLRADITSLIDEVVVRKIDEIEAKCSQYYRPASKTKQNIVSYIKKRLGSEKVDDEYQLIKQRVLIKLKAEKWEDVPVDTLLNSMNIIDESIRVIKADRIIRQVSIFD